MTEEGNIATVDYTLKYGDGSAKSDKSKVIKVDDKWKIDSGK